MGEKPPQMFEMDGENPLLKIERLNYDRRYTGYLRKSVRPHRTPVLHLHRRAASQYVSVLAHPGETDINTRRHYAALTSEGGG
jgi:hypothetical protein